MKLEGVPFKNSETCEGVAFAGPDAPLDMSVITIHGRYPEKGWAVQHQSYEQAYVESGTGQLHFKSGQDQPLAVGDVVLVPPDTRFAWEGDMILIMSCQPAFDPQHYEIEEQQ